MTGRIVKSGALLLCLLALLAGLCTAAYAEEAEAAERTTVEVSTVDEFLAAIAPNTEIVLAEGEYNLTQAASYAWGSALYYHWEGTYDGYELVITDAENLLIRGADGAEVTISTEPRYSNVLRFDGVKGLTLSNLVVGHTPDQGYCTGGVLYLTDCSNVEIQGSHLYGCGTLGITLERCRNVHVDKTEIYECSYGCIDVSGCENVLFENSKFHDCEIISEGFSIRASQDVAIINSEIYNNRGEMFDYLFSADSPGVYLGGLDVHNNELAAIFAPNCVSVTVESCRFINNGSAWAEGAIPAVSPEGERLSAVELDSMKMRMVTWEPKGRQELPQVEAGEDGKIHVSTVDEFLAAIGSNATIYLEPGEYDLSSADTYAGPGGEFFHWEKVFDGYELVITGANQLTIEAESPDSVSIVTAPRYANVLRFENLTGLTVRNVKVGHTIEPGTCTGGVIHMESVNRSNFEGCKLYGCGILGIEGIYCGDVSVFGCEIYECSNGALWFFHCDSIRVDQCNIHDIGFDDGTGVFYFDPYCTDVLVDGQTPEMRY